MSEKFQTTRVDAVTRVSSSEGFTVEVTFGGGAVYVDATGRIPVDIEWLGTPPGVLIYTRSLRAQTKERFDEVLSNVIRALKALGNHVETSEY
jgi:hypothetical protein